MSRVVTRTYGVRTVEYPISDGFKTSVSNLVGALSALHCKYAAVRAFAEILRKRGEILMPR